MNDIKTWTGEDGLKHQISCFDAKCVGECLAVADEDGVTYMPADSSATKMNHDTADGIKQVAEDEKVEQPAPDDKRCTYKAFFEPLAESNLSGFYHCPREATKHNLCKVHQREHEAKYKGQCRYHVKSGRCQNNAAYDNDVFCWRHEKSVVKAEQTFDPYYTGGKEADILGFLGKYHFNHQNNPCDICPGWDHQSIEMVQKLLDEGKVTPEQAFVGLAELGVDVDKDVDTSPPSYSSYSSGSGKSWSGSTYVSCDHKPKPVFTYDGVTYYGGSRSEVEKLSYPKDWLLVSALGHSSATKGVIQASPGWKSLEKYSVFDENVVTIDWPDYGVPAIRVEFWEALHKLAKERGVKNVVFYCMGGHGRTGTALSSMLIRAAGYKPADAVAFVRKDYCKKAVESETQVKFLKLLAGNPDSDEKIKPSK